PGGESFKSMRSRVDKLLKSLENQKRPILLVTHGDIVKMFLASAAGLKIDGFQKFVIEQLFHPDPRSANRSCVPQSPWPRCFGRKAQHAAWPVPLHD
ncbi:MAG: hypothetical protein EBY76_03440, partial [Betaproteobacteria bacterium]|nr:hypothetical protein [Betaproteobacteria bacterium]